MGLDYLQEYGYRVMMAGYNTFLTGGSGVGKTYVLNKFICDQRLRRRKVLVCASTGVAAINVNGSTAHHQFSLDVNPNIKHPISHDRVAELVDADTLVIEEISMLRVDYFDTIMMHYFSANTIRKNMNKPPIQLIVCGDFLQLSPVLTDKDREVLVKAYPNIKSGYAFESAYWDMLGFKVVVLTDIVRQSNTEFMEALNKLRVGDISGLDYIMQNSSKLPIPEALNIYGLNSNVTEYNIAELNKIDSELYMHEASVTGAAKVSDTNYERLLAIKVGARVMSLINKDSQDGTLIYGNGSLGTIVAIGDNYITVEFDCGAIENIEENSVDIYRYTINNKDELEKTLIGTVSQFPIKLAYAATIHKSQGQTFDGLNINPYAWDCGQLYVALSRAKSIDNVYLTSEINPRCLVVSLDVIAFYNSLVHKANLDLDLSLDLTAPRKLEFENADMNKVFDIFKNI